jgi:hypothetical protein
MIQCYTLVTFFSLVHDNLEHHKFYDGYIFVTTFMTIFLLFIKKVSLTCTFYDDDYSSRSHHNSKDYDKTPLIYDVTRMS